MPAVIDIPSDTETHSPPTKKARLNLKGKSKAIHPSPIASPPVTRPSASSSRSATASSKLAPRIVHKLTDLCSSDAEAPTASKRVLPGRASIRPTSKVPTRVDHDVVDLCTSDVDIPAASFAPVYQQHSSTTPSSAGPSRVVDSEIRAVALGSRAAPQSSIVLSSKDSRIVPKVVVHSTAASTSTSNLRPRPPASESLLASHLPPSTPLSSLRSNMPEHSATPHPAPFLSNSKENSPSPRKSTSILAARLPPPSPFSVSKSRSSKQSVNIRGVHDGLISLISEVSYRLSTRRITLI